MRLLSGCVTRPAALKPPTTFVTDPCGAERATTTNVFLDSLGPSRKTEKARLQADHDRALRVVAEIDARAEFHPNSEG